MDRSASLPALKRRLPIGAEVQPSGGVHFRVWAPRRNNVAVEFFDAAGNTAAPALGLDQESGGYFAGFAPAAAAGTRYGFRLDQESKLYPDPASRCQPEGPHGLSEVVDADDFVWHDADWRGVELHGPGALRVALRHVHARGHLVGRGQRRSPSLGRRGRHAHRGHAGRRVRRRVRLGLRRRRSVRADAALRHARRLPPFCRCGTSAPAWASCSTWSTTISVRPAITWASFRPTTSREQHHTDWGDAINFDGENCRAGARVLHRQRRLLDRRVSHRRPAARRGSRDRRRLRRPHSGRARPVACAQAAGDRAHAGHRRKRTSSKRWLMRPPDERRLWARRGLERRLSSRRPRGGHRARRILLRRLSRHAAGVDLGRQMGLSVSRPMEPRQSRTSAARRRSTSTAPAVRDRFCRITTRSATRRRGSRLHELTSPGRHRALTALWLLAPGTPLLFQGQEFSASSAVSISLPITSPSWPSRCARDATKCMRQFPPPGRTRRLPSTFADPCDRRTFEESKLDLSERARNREALRTAPRSVALAARRSRSSRRSGPIASMAPCSPTKRSCCVTSARTATIGWCW